MKNQFKDRIMMDNNCSFNGLKHTLSHDMGQQDETNENRCKLIFFCHHLKRLLSNDITAEENNKNDAENTVSSGGKIFKL